jgi:PKD repeat protein
MFTATPTNGGASPTYNFKVNGTSVQSGTSATYSSSALNNGDAVTCTITSNATCASPTTAGSNTITMSVNPSLSPLVSIGASPSGAICAGTSVMFTATPTNGGASPTYNFKVNGTSVQSGASATYSSSALNNGDAVTCAITSNAACASPTTAGSNSLAETVNPLPVFNYTETDVSCYGGANGEIAVSVTTGTFPYTYSVDGGATFPYSISPITGLAAATYSVVVSDANGCVSGATSVSVQQPSAALTAGASNTGPYSISQTIQLEGSASGGTGSYTYSWYDGATLVSNSQNPTITNATVGDAGTYNLTVTDANHCTASASTYVVVTGGSIYTWIGTTSTDWTFPANWSPPSPTGGPNSCAVDVVINAGGNQPVVPASTPVAVGNMQINANATLTLQSNLSVCKNWVGGSAASGTVVGTGIVVLNGSAAQTISGKTIFDELQLNNSAGAALLSGSEAGINTALDLQTGNFDATNGSLTFLSTSVTQAGIIDNFSGTNQGTLTGSITAQRYYASATLGRNQHLLGSPVSAPALSQFGASGTAGFVIPKPDCDETQMATNSPYGTVFSYHESYVEAPVCGEAQWKVETSGNATNGLGYSILKYGNGTLSLNGAANLNSSYTITGLTNSNWANMSLQNRELSSGWQLVSNPYLATLQINTTNPGFDNQIQVWNANGLYAGTYQVGMVGDDAVVSPFQAFMVHKTNAGGTASYTINASDRVRTAQTFFAQNDNELNIVAQNIVTGTLDQTMIAFNTHASDGFDPQYDANKFGGALNRHTLYSLNNNKWMARNVLNSVNTTSAVAVGFEPGATGSYAFNFNNLSSFDPTTYIYLEDKQANVMYNVRNGVYQFSADSADEWNRFVIHFTPAAQISTLNSTCTEKGSININQPGPANWNYTLSDQASNTIASGMLNELSPVNINVYAGAYTLVLKDNNNYTVTKAINVGGAPLASASFTAPAWAPAQTAINFVSTSQNAATYTWHFGDSTIITDAANVYYTYMQPGTYSVTLNVTSSAGCTSSITKTITVTSVAGIQPVLGNNELSIWSYKNRVYVDFSTLNEVDADIRIFNILGQQIANDRYTSNGLYQKEIDNIDAAYVIVSVKNEDSITTRKLFIVNAK